MLISVITYWGSVNTANKMSYKSSSRSHVQFCALEYIQINLLVLASLQCLHLYTSAIMSNLPHRSINCNSSAQKPTPLPHQ